ncbi:MAG: hypothetical protein PHT79_04345 [Syntrophomonadaceae bacterium]|nr:hypothetical protein [Syntrophomonadaceae bacterium]MDD4548971.1 hypothetical protein [Syntrophomonadaceae bacterium]
MRTLVATALSNAKGRDIYCAAQKVTDQQINILRNTSRQELISNGFTFIKLISLDYPNVKGYAIFFEGHLDEMNRSLKSIERGY